MRHVSIVKPFSVVRSDPTGQSIPTMVVLPAERCGVRFEGPIVYVDHPGHRNQPGGALALTHVEFQRHLDSGDIQALPDE
jgi:hypothetical protein